MKENIFIKVQILVLVLGSFHYSIAKVSDERLCADPECNIGDQDIKENAENKEANIQQFDDLQNPNQDEATREEAVEMTSDENVNLDDQAVESEQEDVLGDSQLERDDSVVQEATYLDPEEQTRDEEGLEFNEDMNLGQQEVTDEGLAISQQSQDTNTLHEAEDTSYHHHQYEEHSRQQEDQYHQDENHHQEDQGHNHSSSEDQLFPDWFAVLIHDHAIIDGDRLALVAIISDRLHQQIMPSLTETDSPSWRSSLSHSCSSI